MFFIIIIVSLLIINIYPLFKILEALPPLLIPKVISIALFLLLTSLFLYRMIRGEKLPLSTSRLVSHVAFTWLAFLIYLSLTLLFTDLFRLIYSLSLQSVTTFTLNSIFVKRAILLLSIVIATTTLLIGNRNFRNPTATHLTVELDSIKSGEKIKIALLSDIHLSSYIHAPELSRYVEMINGEKPHLVLIAGDLVDRDIEPLEQGNLSTYLSSIKSEWGIYAVSGNHEFYGGKREQIINFFERSGIKFLIDSVVTVADKITVVGREDSSNPKRSSLERLISSYQKESTQNQKLPIIVLDHRLIDVDEVVNEAVDFYFSGHTHNGQFWPGNLFVKFLNTIPYGYKKIDQTHFYVSSGVGLWGPKIRVNTLSEILFLELVGRATPR